MKVSSKNSGFGIIGIVILIILIGLLGLIGWKVWEAQQKNTTSQMPINPNKDYFVIQEWGVQLKPVAGLTGLKALKRESTIPNTEEMMLITGEMQKLNAACSGEAEGSRPLGAIFRTQEQLAQPGNNQMLKQIGNYYYYYYAPASSCSPDASAEAIQAGTLAKLKSSLDSLTASD